MMQYQGLSAVKRLIACLSFCSASMALAQASDVAGQERVVSRTSSETRQKDFARPSGIGLSLFAGPDLGYTYLDPQSSGESIKTGPHLALRAYLALFTDQVELDFGGAFVRNEVKGSSDTQESDGTKRKVKDVSVITTVGALHAAGNIALTPRWQVGLIGQMMLGADASFSPNVGRRYQDPASFIGGQLQYTRPIGPVNGRLGLMYMSDVNIIERQMHVAMVNFSVEVPIIARKTIIQKRHEREQRTLDQIETVEKPVPVPRAVPVLIVVFDEALVNFVTASAELSPRSSAMLREMGAFLAQNQASWKRIIVEGHTDKRGSRDFNQTLSENRAASVRDALVQGGVAAANASSLGYGFDRPIDLAETPVGLARNRRVELKFEGVTNDANIRTGISAIQLRYK